MVVDYGHLETKREWQRQRRAPEGGRARPYRQCACIRQIRVSGLPSPLLRRRRMISRILSLHAVAVCSTGYMSKEDSTMQVSSEGHTETEGYP